MQIVLTTDSRVTPFIHLYVTVYSRRGPPYVVTARGDLNYIGAPSRGEPRELVVVTAEPSAESRRPILECALPFVSFEFKERQEKPYPEPGLVERSYIYRVNVKGQPRGDFFSGEVKVIDPWNNSIAARVGVSGRELPSVRSAPERVVLTVDAGGKKQSGGEFVILSEEPISDLLVRPEGGDESPLEVVRVKGDSPAPEQGVPRFSIAGKPGRPIPVGVYRIDVQTSALPAGKLVVPVMVRNGG